MEGRWTIYLCGGCARPAFGVGGEQHCTDTDGMEPQRPVPVVPCDDAAIERAAVALCEQGIRTLNGPLATWERHADDFRRIALAAFRAGETP